MEIDVDFSLSARRVIHARGHIIEQGSKPVAIRCDKGSGYISDALQMQARKRDIQLHYTRPGNPQRNAYIERYNRTVRCEWLNQMMFETIAQVQDFATHWLWTCHHEYPK